MGTGIGINFGGGPGAAPLGSDHRRGQNMSGPLGFLTSNTHLATRNPKFRNEIELDCDKDPFFLWSAPKFGG